jgi:type I restriction enzyme R subunit
VDILNKDDFEKELEELGSLRSKADAITSRMTKSISSKRDENPAYYDSFSKRIKETLELYKEKVISETLSAARISAVPSSFPPQR